MFLYLSRYLYLVVLFLNMKEQRYVHLPYSEFCTACSVDGRDSDVTTRLKRAERRKLPAKTLDDFQDNVLSIL